MFVDYYGVNRMEVYFLYLGFLPLGMNYPKLHSNPTQTRCSCETNLTSFFIFCLWSTCLPRTKPNIHTGKIKIFYPLAVSLHVIPVLQFKLCFKPWIACPYDIICILICFLMRLMINVILWLFKKKNYLKRYVLCTCSRPKNKSLLLHRPEWTILHS